MYSLILLPLLAAMFLSINMGGSGTAAAFSSSYGARLIRKDLIPGLFGLFVLIGAVTAGKEVTTTIGDSILPSEAMTLGVTTVILLAIGFSMLFANLLKIPQSTSQSTVCALIAVGMYEQNLMTGKLVFQILPSWVVLPLTSLLLMTVIGKFIYRPIARKRIIKFNELSRHPVLRGFVIASSCYVAYAIGANNVANASGPITGLLINEFNVTGGHQQLLCIILATLIIAPCFALGSSIFGQRVLETTGDEIIKFGPIGALAISLITGTILLLASIYEGIPTPLAQLNIGAVIGLGIYKEGFRGILKKTAVQKILVVWMIAPFIAFCLAWAMTAVIQ
jgi:phosphate/sulfate permease